MRERIKNTQERIKRKRINEKNAPIKYDPLIGHGECKKCGQNIFLKEYEMDVCANCGQRYDNY